MNQSDEGAGKKERDATERQKLQELSRMVNGAVYREVYMQAMVRLKTLVEEYETECINKTGRNPVEQMGCRIKSAESIAEKLRKKGCLISCKSAKRNLNDLAGIRVVCSGVEDVYHLQNYLTGRDEIRIVKIKDYIKMPKENGYQSLHLIVEMEQDFREKTRGSAEEVFEKLRLEIQIRTEEMHNWAQRDHKLFYKNG